MSPIFALAFLGLSGQDDNSPPPETAPFPQRLAYWRSEFEDVLKPPLPFEGTAFVGYTTVGGTRYGEGLYPVGSAAERFLVSYDDKGVNLLFERRHGKITAVDWRVRLVASKNPKPAQGTVEAYLAGKGYVISPAVHLTVQMRRELSNGGSFAYYNYTLLGGGTQAVLPPDGSLSPFEETHPDPFAKNAETFPITAEEQKLLKHTEIGRD